MRKEILLIGILLILVISSCQQEAVTEPGINEQSAPKESAVCSAPYIMNGSNCCLDKDNNGICDSGEVEKINNESQPQVQVAENPKQPAEIMENKEVKGVCFLPGGIKCADFKINSTDIQVRLLNSIGYDAISVVIEAQNCGDSSILSLKSGESDTFTIRCNYALTGSNYYGVLSVQYTDAKTGISYYDSGRLNATIN